MSNRKLDESDACLQTDLFGIGQVDFVNWDGFNDLISTKGSYVIKCDKIEQNYTYGGLLYVYHLYTQESVDCVSTALP